MHGLSIHTQPCTRAAPNRQWLTRPVQPQAFRLGRLSLQHACSHAVYECGMVQFPWRRARCGLVTSLRAASPSGGPPSSVDLLAELFSEVMDEAEEYPSSEPYQLPPDMAACLNHMITVGASSDTFQRRFCTNCGRPLMQSNVCQCGHARLADDNLLDTDTLKTWQQQLQQQLQQRQSQQSSSQANPTGLALVFDERMMQHRASLPPYPERPERLLAIMTRLSQAGLLERCQLLPAREATNAELYEVHAVSLVRAVQEASAAAAAATAVSMASSGTLTPELLSSSSSDDDEARDAPPAAASSAGLSNAASSPASSQQLAGTVDQRLSSKTARDSPASDVHSSGEETWPVLAAEDASTSRDGQLAVWADDQGLATVINSADVRVGATEVRRSISGDDYTSLGGGGGADTQAVGGSIGAAAAGVQVVGTAGPSIAGSAAHSSVSPVDQATAAAVAAASMQGTALNALTGTAAMPPVAASSTGAVHAADEANEGEAGQQELVADEEEEAEEGAEDDDDEDGLDEPFILSADTLCSAGTYQAAKLAAGAAAQLVHHVLSGQAGNGLGIIRPIGHQASRDTAQGGCYFNNAAVAAAAAQEAGAEKVMVLDWDVHHARGTQSIFEDDPDILVVSLHAIGEDVYPGTGGLNETGYDDGQGYTINIPWQGTPVGDAEYVQAMLHVVLPVCQEFQPDIIIVSAGFSAAQGDLLGDCNVTPAGFAHMTHMLKGVAPLVMLLEGGYNLDATARCVEACARVLLGERPPLLEGGFKMSKAGTLSVMNAIMVQAQFWKSLYPFSLRGWLGAIRTQQQEAARQQQYGEGEEEEEEEELYEDEEEEEMEEVVVPDAQELQQLIAVYGQGGLTGEMKTRADRAGTGPVGLNDVQLLQSMLAVTGPAGSPAGVVAEEAAALPARRSPSPGRPRPSPAPYLD